MTIIKITSYSTKRQSVAYTVAYAVGPYTVHFVNGEAFPLFPIRSEVYGYHPRDSFKIVSVAIAVEKLPRSRRRQKCDASASQSNNFLASVVNASSRRHWGLLQYRFVTVRHESC